MENLMHAGFKPFKGLGFLLLLLPLCGLSAPRTSGVSLHGVPASVAWVVNGEARKVAALPMIQRLLREKSRGSGAALGRLQALAQQSGVDLTTDVQRVQIMGMGATGIVAIVDGRWDVSRLQRVAQAQPGARKLGVRNIELVHIPGRRAGEALFMHFSGQQRILAGSTAASVLAVTESLAQTGIADDVTRVFGKMQGASPGALVVMGLRDGDALVKLIPEASMLLEADSIVGQIGRLRQNFLGVHLAAQAADEIAANNMTTLLSGLQAMFAFRAISDPQWTTIAQTMQIQAVGNRVFVQFSVDPDSAESLLATMLRELDR